MSLARADRLLRLAGLAIALGPLIIGAAAPGDVAAAPPAQFDAPLTYELADTWADLPRPSLAGHFLFPRDISSLPDETVTVLGRAFGVAEVDGEPAEGDAVHVLDPDGTPRALLALGDRFAAPTRLDGGFDGVLRVLGRSTAGPWQVVGLAPAGAHAHTIALDPNGRPVDVAAGPNDDVYVTVSAGPDRIDVHAPDGQLVDRIIPDEMGSEGPDQRYRYLLRRLDIGLDGTIYVMAVATRDCPPGPPGPPPPRPTPTPTPRPSVAGEAESPEQAPPDDFPCSKTIVLIFEPDHTFREEVPNAHTTDIAAGVSGVFVTSDPPPVLRPVQRVYELYEQAAVFNYRLPEPLDVPLPHSASHMQLDVASDGQVHATTNIGAPFYRGALTFADPRTSGGPGSVDPTALGIYERPPLEGPRHPLRIDAAADVLLLEASYQRYGPDGQVNTAVDVAHDVEAIQRWSTAGFPVWQAAQHDHLLRDGADGSDLLKAVVPLVDIAYSGDDIFAVSSQVVWRRDDALPPPWYRHTSGAHYIAASADGGLVAVLNASGQRVLVLDRQGRRVYDRTIADDGDKILASDLALSGDRVYLTDQGRNVVMVRGIDGTDLGEWPTHDGPRRVATAANGDVFVLGRGGFGLHYAPDGELRGAWRVPVFHGDVVVEAFDIAVGDDGRAYVSFMGLSDPNPADVPAGRGLGYDIDAAGVWVFEPVPVDDEHPAPPDAEACIAWPDKWADPPIILLGEEVDVTLDVGGQCPGHHEPGQLVIVLDTSWSMHDFYYPGTTGPGALRRAKDVLVALLGSIDASAIEIGLITFSDGAGVEVPLPGDLGRVRGSIVTRRADGDTQMGAGVLLARSELTGPRGDPAVRRTILIVSDGLFKDDPRPAIALAHADGIEVAALVLSTPEFDAAALVELEDVIGDTGLIFIDPLPETVGDLVGRVSTYVPEPGLFETITIDDIVPANMRYLDGSAQPPATFDPATRTLRWTLGPVSAAEGVRLTYRLRPLEPGDWPTNVEARATYRDALGFDGELPFPVPEVLVLAPGMQSTETPPPPTPEPTATTRPIYKIYLPFAERPPLCVRTEVHIDVVLALDMSTSMYRTTSAGRTKHEAAIEAAQMFIDQLQLAPGADGRADQVAIVGFNDRAWTESGFTRDAEALDRALGRLLAQIREGTRLDLVFDEAQREIDGPRRQGANQPALILLTDGLPNRVPTPDPRGKQEDTVLAAAKRVKDAGTVVYTVGLGKPDDIMAWMLQAAATEPSMYYYAPDGEDLAGIYQRILVRLVCEGD